MGSIQFNPSAGNIKPEVLNHRQASPLKANNVQLRIGSEYLQDLTPEGIERFVDKHTKFLDGSKLNVKDVQAFVQKLAQNPEAVKNMTFDLKDPELGLFRDDGITTDHIKGAFSVDFKENPTGSAKQAIFIDATSVKFDLKEKEDTIQGAETRIDNLEGQKRGAQRNISRAEQKFDTAQRLLGEGSYEKYEQLTARQGEIKTALEGLEEDKTKYQAELKKEDVTPERKTELQRILSGIDQQVKELNAEQKSISEQLSEKKGYPLEKYALKELPGLKEKVDNARAADKTLDTQIAEQRQVIQDTKGTTAAQTPAEAPANAEEAPAVDADEAPVDAEEVQIGNHPTLKGLKEKSPAAQAAELKVLSAEDQKTFVGSLSEEEQGKLKTEVEAVIKSTENATSARVRKSHTQHKELLQVINDTPAARPPAETPVTPDTSGTNADDTKVADGPTTPSAPATPAAPAVKDGKRATPNPDVKINEAADDVAEGELGKKSKPIEVKGKVVTLENFSSLTIKDKFEVLMQADAEYLEGLLRKMSRSERNQIRSMARAELTTKYAGAHTTSTAPDGTTYSVQKNEDGTSAYVGVHNGKEVSRVSIPPADAERASRAQYIIDLIDKINAEEDGTTTTTTPASPDDADTPAVSGNQSAGDVDIAASSGLKTEKYTVKRGETAASIADNLYGNKLRGVELLILNPELEKSVLERLEGDRTAVNTPLLSGDQTQLEIEVIKRGEKELPQSVINSHAAKTAETPERPKVTVEAASPETQEKPDPKPEAKPEVKTEVKTEPAAPESPKVVVEEVEEKAEDERPESPTPRATS